MAEPPWYRPDVDDRAPFPGPFDTLHVVVTGGTGALGTAVVARLLDGGATCHLPVFDRGELERFAHRDHERVRPVPDVDLTDEAAVADYYGALPGLWASIHCVGGFAMAPLGDTSAAGYRRLQELNATTCFLCCREAVGRIRARREGPPGGRLVNVAARPALEPRSGAGMVAYTMSKAAVAALTAALAEELAAEGIWVNAVAPSTLDTPANRAAMPGADRAAWTAPEAAAETVVFLASSANRATRGAVAPV